MRGTAVIGLAVTLFTAPAVAEKIDLAELTCEGALPAGTDLRITYGPFWDGAWQLRVVNATASTVPEVVVTALDVAPADFTAEVLETHRRPGNQAVIREMQRAALVMIEAMGKYSEDAPELARERRPLTIQVRVGEVTGCAEGYANWPRIPGTYFYEAVDTLRTAVMIQDSTYDPWRPIRLQLRQVTGSWAR